MTTPQSQLQPQLNVQERERPGRILIVDDDLAAVEPLALRLRWQGYEVLATAAGEEGIALARGSHPDVILLDLCLPDFNGLEVAKILTADNQTSDIPIVFLSGLGDDETLVRECRAAGGTYYLRKPYDCNVLLLVLSQAVAEHRLWHDMSAPEEDFT